MSELHPRIAVIGGAGYVGLITGVGFASLGYNTTCVDINEQRVNQLTNASSPIHEPGLEPLLRQLLDNRQINFTTDAANALANSNIVVIAVGSPSLPNGRADISQAIKAIETVATNASPNSTIIVKSTLPIGVYPRIEEILAAKAPTLSVVFNPEFLREGHGLYDFYHPERVVVGSNSPTALATIRKLYQPLLDASYKLPEELNITPKQTIPYIETDATTAQMIKYASNVFLATRVSFINELASICESVNADVKTVTTGLGLDSRIGSSYTQPGPGFGGPCLEKDLSALIEIAEMNHASPAFFKAVLERNRFRLREIKRDIDSLCGGELIGKNIVIWGIAFKAGTNDARTSISIRLATLLADQNANVRAHDPLVTADDLRQLEPRAVHYSDPYESARDADIIVLMNDDPAYKNLDFQRISTLTRNPIIYDTRYCLPQTNRLPRTSPTTPPPVHNVRGLPPSYFSHHLSTHPSFRVFCVFRGLFRGGDGAGDGIRTRGPLLGRQMLYH